jgi:hypothetical protein
MSAFSNIVLFLYVTLPLATSGEATEFHTAIRLIEPFPLENFIKCYEYVKFR